MKRLLCVMLAALCISGCAAKKAPEKAAVSTKTDINGVWISYIEMDACLKSGDFYKNFSEIVSKCKAFGITDIFMHAVPFCDAYYPSEIYTKRESANSYSGDVLKTAVELAHTKNMRLHLWMNPYRVKTSDIDTSTLPQNSIAYKWLNDENPDNDKNVCISGGIYLNPGCSEVRQTVISAVREAAEKYDIDGVHFDDYFYPTTDPAFDSAAYEEYAAGCSVPITLEEFRRASVNALISGCYTALKFIRKDIIFSVSPAADIEKNRTAYYADISAWCESRCVDVIIPQIYFGFLYPTEKFRFENLLDAWKNLTAGTGVELCIGLAAYKTGTAVSPDCTEWQNADDILSRQVSLCKSDRQVSGMVFYSYTALFSESELNSAVRENIKKAMDGLNF